MGKLMKALSGRPPSDRRRMECVGLRSIDS